MDIASLYVPLDGSERAEMALVPAITLAECCDAEVVLLATPWPGERLETVERYLDARTAFLERVKVRPLLVQDRDAADAICTVGAQSGAMVCMSTRGRGAARGSLLGSVGEAVLRETSRPVALVGPSFGCDWQLRPPPVVIAGIDGSERSFAALRDAGDLAAALGGRVRAIQVVRPVDVPVQHTIDENTSAMLDRIVAGLREQGTRVDIEVRDGFDPAAALTAAAQQLDAAFIAIASHGRTGIARAVLGSVAMATAKRARCPVLVSGPGVHAHVADGDG